MRTDDKWLSRVAGYSARDLGLQDTGDHGKMVLDLIADLHDARTLLERVSADYCKPNGEFAWENTKARVLLMNDVRAMLNPKTKACGASHPFRKGLVCARIAEHDRLHCNVVGGAFGYEWSGDEQCDCLIDPTMFHHRPDCPARRP